MLAHDIEARNNAVNAALAKQAGPYLWGVNTCITTGAFLCEAAGGSAEDFLAHPDVVELHNRPEKRAMVWARQQPGGFQALYERILSDCGAVRIDEGQKPGDVIVTSGTIAFEQVKTDLYDDGIIPLCVSTAYEWLGWTPIGLKPITGSRPADDLTQIWTWRSV